MVRPASAYVPVAQFEWPARSRQRRELGWSPTAEAPGFAAVCGYQRESDFEVVSLSHDRVPEMYTTEGHDVPSRTQRRTSIQPEDNKSSGGLSPTSADANKDSTASLSGE